MLDIKWLNYPEQKPSFKFGLYPVVIKEIDGDEKIMLLYYYPIDDEWSEDCVIYTDIVIKFIDISVYPEIRW